MEYRKLGNTGLETSVIALGCEAFVEDNSNAMKFLDMAEEAGINYFDLFRRILRPDQLLEKLSRADARNLSYSLTSHLYGRTGSMREAVILMMSRMPLRILSDAWGQTI